MTKYYRVIKENPIWETGCILKEYQPSNYNNKGYEPIEDIWNLNPNQDEYLTANIVENQTKFFERVYADNVDKMIFKTKDELKKVFNKFRK